MIFYAKIIEEEEEAYCEDFFD
jgi:hypothetical protein